MSLRSLLVFLVLPTGFLCAQGGGSGFVAGVFTRVQGLQGVPFSADVVTESTRVLGDGNRIHQELHGKQYRDSEGRTRSETEFLIPSQEPPSQRISIVDPVQGVFIVLDSGTKMATIHHMSLPPAQANQTNASPGTLAGKLQPAAPARVETREQIHREELGEMEIEGFTVKGTKYTRTIPAGRIGNEQPITSVDENWASPALKGIVLLQKHHDPE